MKYSKPPLPFMGSKIAMLKNIKTLLENMRYSGHITKDTIFYDVFGGSGPIAHNIKQWYPQNRVIWNDFDNFQERLNNISKTESLRAKLYELCEDNKSHLIPQETQEQMKKIIEQEEYIDLVAISSYIRFHGNYAKSKEDFKATLYHRIPKNPLCAKGYLENVERVSKHYLELLREIPQEQKGGKAFLILDPPYLQTISGNYRDCYTLKDFCLLVEHIFKPYIFFSSDKSDIAEFFEFYKKYNDVFARYYIDKETLKIGKNQTDYMIYSYTQKGLFECLE